MADYFPGKIEIGGTVTSHRLALLFDLVAGDGPDYDQSFVDFAQFQEHVASLKGEPLQIANSQARYGQFEEVEQFCRDTKLSFVRCSDAKAKYEYSSEVVWWAPGMKDVASSPATQDGDPTVLLTDVKTAITEGRLDQFLADHTPVDVPPFTVKEI